MAGGGGGTGESRPDSMAVLSVGPPSGCQVCPIRAESMGGGGGGALLVVATGSPVESCGGGGGGGGDFLSVDPLRLILRLAERGLVLRLSAFAFGVDRTRFNGLGRRHAVL